MTAHLTATGGGGYNWLLVGVVFLVWGLISGLLPRFFQLLVLFVTPKIKMRHKINSYKAELVIVATERRKEEEQKNYWKRMYFERRDHAEEVEFEEMEERYKSPLDDWRERRRWEEHREQDEGYEFNYRIKAK